MSSIPIHTNAGQASALPRAGCASATAPSTPASTARAPTARRSPAAATAPAAPCRAPAAPRSSSAARRSSESTMRRKRMKRPTRDIGLRVRCTATAGTVSTAPTHEQRSAASPSGAPPPRRHAARADAAAAVRARRRRRPSASRRPRSSRPDRCPAPPPASTITSTVSDAAVREPGHALLHQPEVLGQRLRRRHHRPAQREGEAPDLARLGLRVDGGGAVRRDPVGRRQARCRGPADRSCRGASCPAPTSRCRCS